MGHFHRLTFIASCRPRPKRERSSSRTLQRGTSWVQAIEDGSEVACIIAGLYKPICTTSSGLTAIHTQSQIKRIRYVSSLAESERMGIDVYCIILARLLSDILAPSLLTSACPAPLQPVAMPPSRLVQPVPTGLYRLLPALLYALRNGRAGDVDAPLLKLSNLVQERQRMDQQWRYIAGSEPACSRSART